MSNAKLGRTAIGANLRGGHLVVTIGEAQAYGGVIKGSLALANVDAGVDVKSQLQFSDVDLESCLGQLFGLRRLEGKGNIAFAVEGSGDSVLGVTRTLERHRDADRARTARSPASMSSSCCAGWSGGRCPAAANSAPAARPIDKIAVGLKIEQGTADGRGHDDRGAGGAAGARPAPPRSRQRELDLKGTAALVAACPAGRAAVRAAVHRAGSWDDPIMLPDAEALIRRSGAAAPLLDAVARRGARATPSAR